MNIRVALLALLLLDFLAVTGIVLAEYGAIGWIEPLLASWVGRLAAFDLVLALGVAWGFLWKDARARAINPVPYLIVTLLLGSAGPLAYLIRRELGAGAPVATAAPARF